MRLARLLPLLVLLASCGGGEKVSGPPPRAPDTIRLREGFVQGGTIPKRYTCDGPGITPPLSATNLPPGGRSFAVLVEDPDAPGGTFVHWTLWDLQSPAFARDHVPAGTKEGKASNGKTGWTPPCPPSGTHRYVLTVYSLRAPLDLDAGAEPGDVRAAIAKEAIARGTITGRYGR